MNAHQLWKITANPIDPDKRVRYREFVSKRTKKYVPEPKRQEKPNNRPKKRGSGAAPHLQRTRYSAFFNQSSLLSDKDQLSKDASNNNDNNNGNATAKQKSQRLHASSPVFTFGTNSSNLSSSLSLQDSTQVDPMSEGLVNITTGKLHKPKRRLLRDIGTDTILLRGNKYEQADADLIQFKKSEQKLALRPKTAAYGDSSRISTLIQSDNKSKKNDKNSNYNNTCTASITGRNINIQCAHHQHYYNNLKSHNIFEPEVRNTPRPSRSTFHNVMNMQ